MSVNSVLNRAFEGAVGAVGIFMFWGGFLALRGILRWLFPPSKEEVDKEVAERGKAMAEEDAWNKLQSQVKKK